MIVYHGTTTWNMRSLMSGDFSKHSGLYVTDSFERAARYANSQADQVVTRRTLPLSSCAVVVEIKVVEEPNWRRRPDSHPSLDQCEAIISQGRLIRASIGRPGLSSLQEHRNIQAFQQIVPVDVLEPHPSIHNNPGR